MMEDWNYIWVLFSLAPAAILLGWGINLCVRRRVAMGIPMAVVGLSASLLFLWFAPRLHPLAFCHALFIGGTFFWVGWRNYLWWSIGFMRHIKEQRKGYLLLYLRIKNLSYRLLYLVVLGGTYIFFLYLAFEFPWGMEFELGGFAAAIYPLPLAATLILGWVTTQIYGRSGMIIVDDETKLAKLMHLASPEWMVKFEECSGIDLVYHPMRPKEMLLVIRTVYGNDLIVDQGRNRRHMLEIATWFRENLGLPMGERSDASISVGR
jgi:hypothetical protein